MVDGRRSFGFVAAGLDKVGTARSPRRAALRVRAKERGGERLKSTSKGSEMLRGTLGAIAIAITIATVAGLAAHFAPLLSRHADQDKCTFGPVSNEQYRAY